MLVWEFGLLVWLGYFDVVFLSVCLLFSVSLLYFLSISDNKKLLVGKYSIDICWLCEWFQILFILFLEHTSIIAAQRETTVSWSMSRRFLLSRLVYYLLYYNDFLRLVVYNIYTYHWIQGWKCNDFVWDIIQQWYLLFKGGIL